MSQPTTYDRQISFTLFSSENPGAVQSGADFDTEFNAVKLTLDETLANLALIQDDDGALARGSVGRAQLDSSITLGFGAPSAWTALTAYEADESTVFNSSKFYLCNTTHTSGSVFDATKWDEIADFSASNTIDDGSISTAKLADGAVQAAKIEDLAVTNAKLATNAVSTGKILDAAVTPAKMSTVAAFQDALIPAGVIWDYAGTTAPTGWLLCYGQSLLRADYPSLFSAISTTYGAADGTHFTLPDYRGRVGAGKDDMGGSSANRLTNADDGLNGDTLGATGGGETQALAQGNLPSANFTVSGITLIDDRVLRTNEAVPHEGGVLALPGAGGVLAASIAKVGIETASGSLRVSAQGSAASGGSSTAFGVVQPTIVFNKIIKAH